MLIDTHCHLDDESAGSAESVLARAREAGVCAFVAIGVGGAKAVTETLQLASRHGDVVATVGVHPHDAAGFEAQRDGVSELTVHPRVVAVGEVGLDYHYDRSPREIQRDVFRHFVSVARSARLPLVIHTRQAPHDTLEILREERASDVGGVIHCFSEDREFARGALDLGFDLSFSGIVTFKNATAVQDVGAWAPGGRILVETDSPYLAPVPHRGKVNEPALVVHTAAKLAELRGVDISQICEITTENAIRRFGSRLAEAARVGQHETGRGRRT